MNAWATSLKLLFAEHLAFVNRGPVFLQAVDKVFQNYLSRYRTDRSSQRGWKCVEEHDCCRALQSSGQSRFFSSTKRCSTGGKSKTFVALSEGRYRCDGCGMEMDRDANAAINLAQYAEMQNDASPQVGEQDKTPELGKLGESSVSSRGLSPKRAKRSQGSRNGTSAGSSSPVEAP